MIDKELKELVSVALRRALDDGVLEGEIPDEIHFERPKRREHGDLATNVALVIASGRADPRATATTLVDHLPESDLVEAVEVAGPGFLNFRLSPTWLHDVVRRAAEPGGRFGRSDVGVGTSVNVEFVSANPTGPLNIVSGRHAAVGDTIAALLEATGHSVVREFYLNDAGRQIDLFGRSIAIRYLQLFDVAVELGPDGYQGDYIIDIARQIANEQGDRWVAAPAPDRDEYMRAAGLNVTIGWMRASLERFGSTFDVWFSERELHERGAVEKAIARLQEAGFTHEEDGALFFESSRFGDDKDRVILRSDGRPTYSAADAAYMLDKIERGFDRLIYLLGADHHGTLPRFKALADAFGYGHERTEFPLVQIVRMKTGTETLKGSKRSGVIFELNDLVDEVGVDAVRYTFLTRSMDSPLDFDVELAKEQAPENPVYYVQYAHARICSILRTAAGSGGGQPDVESADLALLTHPSEDALMRKLATYEEAVPEAAALRAPQRMTHYIEGLASDFSSFYRDCRVVSEDESLTKARLTLCLATKAVIADALGLLGVSAPERM